MKKVVILDGLCIAPYYDYYLTKALEKKYDEIYLLSTTFSNDVDLYKTLKREKMLDSASKLSNQNKKYVKGLRVLEYFFNLLLLTYSVFRKEVSVIHIQWLPMLRYINIEYYFVCLWKKLGVKIVYTTHNLLPHDTGRKFYKIYKKVYNIADVLICHVNSTKAGLEKEFNINPDKIRIIPHGPLFENFSEISKEDACKKLEIPNKKNVLLLGFIKPYKGVEFLIDTWKKVTERLPDAQLIICGKGKEDYIKSITEKIDSLNLNDFIQTKFRFLTTEEVPLYHYASDVIVFPYKKIDQSGALYTAMATKKPIITTKVGGFKEIIRQGDNGYLVEYGNTDEFSAKMIELLNNKKIMLEMGNVNYNLIKDKYSWYNIADKTIDIYLN